MPIRVGSLETIPTDLICQSQACPSGGVGKYGYDNCSWYPWNCPQRTPKETGTTGDRRKNQDQQVLSAYKIN